MTTDARRALALGRLVRSVQDYRQCLMLPTGTPDKTIYEITARREMFKRLTELEQLPEAGEADERGAERG